MRETIRVAAVQLNSGADKWSNVEDGIALIDKAASLGASFVALPEVWTYMGESAGVADNAEPVPGPTIDRLAEVARRHRIWLHCGSIFERVQGEPRVYNTNAVLDPDGNLIARYRKIHMFDIAIEGRTGR
jgi:predicted amidohydrolase